MGLLQVKRICGNAPVVYTKLRVNLSDLAGVLDPSGIEEGIVPADSIAFVYELFHPVSESVPIDAYLLSKMRKTRRMFEYAHNDASQTTADLATMNREPD